MTIIPMKTTALPLGPEVATHAAQRPAPITIEGRYCRLRPLDPARDASLLFERTHGPDDAALWAYLPYGPFADATAFRTWTEANSASTDPLFFEIGRAHV